MKNIIVCIALALSFSAVHAQMMIPRSAKQDNEHIMSEAYWKLWNPKVQARIDADIDRYRKADAVITLQDVADGTSVEVKQVSSDFFFGANIFNFNQLGSKERNDRYKALFGSLFNSATVSFYWRAFEPVPDDLRFREAYWDTEEFWNGKSNPKSLLNWRRPATDPVIQFLHSKGLRIQGHPLIWGNRKWQHPEWIIDNMMTPEEHKQMGRLLTGRGNVMNYRNDESYTDEYKSMSVPQLEALLPNYTKTLQQQFEKRIVDIAKYYGDRVNSWDVCNESAVDYSKGLLVQGSGLCKSTYGLMPGDYTYHAFKTAERAFPKSVVLNINDYLNNQAYVDQVKELKSRGCKIDLMGSQMHLFNPQQCADVAAGKEIETPNFVWDLMKTLSAADVPLHLSEITITAPNDTHEGRMIQAIIAQNLYRIWFSTEKMAGITWWNVVDNCGAPGEPTTSGLVTRDVEMKPAFYALDNLINHEWRTNLNVKTGKNGTVRFRGFRGKYLISWIDKSGNRQELTYLLK